MALAVTEWASIAKSDTYDAPREATRIRLMPEEHRTLRYVLCEWGGEVGLASSMAAQLERLAALPKLIGAEPAPEPPPSEDGLPYVPPTEEELASGADLVRLAFGKSVKLSRKHSRPRRVRSSERTWRDDWERDRQHTFINPSAPSSYHGWEMTPMDRWCNVRRDDRGGIAKQQEQRDNVHHAWRALCRLAARFSPSLVVLNALYGDMPPGLPQRGLWAKSLDEEYRRVVRYVDQDAFDVKDDLSPLTERFLETSGSGAALDALVHVERRRYASEFEDAWKTRVAGAQLARGRLLSDLARACERLIVRASQEYRSAWRVT